MNSTKEAEYIAEIVALKSKVKTLSLKALKISEINAQLEIIDISGCIKWEFVQPEIKIETHIIGFSEMKMPNYTPPRIICRLIQPVE